MSIRVHKTEGMWQDIHEVFTWNLHEGALVLHTRNPEPGPGRTGIEILAVYAPGKWTHFHVIP